VAVGRPSATHLLSKHPATTRLRLRTRGLEEQGRLEERGTGQISMPGSAAAMCGHCQTSASAGVIGRRAIGSSVVSAFAVWRPAPQSVFLFSGTTLAQFRAPIRDILTCPSFLVGARTGLIDFDVDKYVSMIFIEPMCAFGMPKSFRMIAPVRRIQIITFKVISVVYASDQRFIACRLRDAN